MRRAIAPSEGHTRVGNLARHFVGTRDQSAERGTEALALKSEQRSRPAVLAAHEQLTALRRLDTQTEGAEMVQQRGPRQLALCGAGRRQDVGMGNQQQLHVAHTPG